MRGFSLVEILWVLVIVVIVSMMAVPTYQFVFKKFEHQMVGSELVRALAMTRSEAVSRRKSVTLCSSLDKKTCGGSWLDGYIVLSDKEVLAVFQNKVHEGRLNWSASLARRKIVYDAKGFTHGENGTFWYCSDNSVYPVSAVVLNKIGRVYVVPEKRLKRLRYRCS